MRAAALGLLAALPACHDCYLEVVEGTSDDRPRDLAPGARITLRACFDDQVLTCGGLWLVNGSVGGSAELGTIDGCGHYVAPAVFPRGASEVVIEANFPGHAELGWCEYAYLSLYVRP